MCSERSVCEASVMRVYTLCSVLHCIVCVVCVINTVHTVQGCTKLVRDERKHATQETLLVGTMITTARILHSGDLLLR